MVERASIYRKLFLTVNYILLTILSVVCFLPLLHLAAVSCSNKAAAAANLINFWPKGFNIQSYLLILNTPRFINAFIVSLKRVIIGTAINIILTTLTAYVLSREDTDLKGRKLIMWYFIIPMLFYGGLIPTYLLVSKVGLVDSFWALIIPTAVPIWDIIIMMNFFRSLPRSLYEAAMLDGAHHIRILFQIFIPISIASIATITLFSMVGHWNAWFDGMIYINDPDHQPLQTYIHNIVTQGLDIQLLAKRGDFRVIETVSNETLKAAQVFVATVPILVVYPFLQKYFVTGITIGSVKG
jgi:putative aldouronate transport system permease protein